LFVFIFFGFCKLIGFLGIENNVLLVFFIFSIFENIEFHLINISAKNGYFLSSFSTFFIKNLKSSIVIMLSCRASWEIDLKSYLSAKISNEYDGSK